MTEAREGTLGLHDFRVPSIMFESKETVSKEEMSDVALTKSGELERKTYEFEMLGKAREGTVWSRDCRVASVTPGSQMTSSKEEMSSVSLNKAGKGKLLEILVLERKS